MPISEIRFTDWFEFVKSDAASRYHGMDFVVLGGGPSLKSFDLSFCKDKVTIGVNAIGRIYQPVFYYVHDPWAIYENISYIDPSRSNLVLSNIVLEWSKWQRIFRPDRNPEMWTTPWGEDLDVGVCIDRLVQKYSSVGQENDHKELYSIYSGHYASTREDAERHGHLYHQVVSTGIEAIDFAIELGAKHVYLIGFDGYSADPSKDHFYHHETFVKNADEKSSKNWKYKNFEYFALEMVAKRAVLRARGGEMTLLNADSVFIRVLPNHPSAGVTRRQTIKNRFWLRTFLPFYVARYDSRIKQSVEHTMNLMDATFGVSVDNRSSNAIPALAFNPLVGPHDLLLSPGYRLAQILDGVYRKARQSLAGVTRLLIWGKARGCATTRRN